MITFLSKDSSVVKILMKVCYVVVCEVANRHTDRQTWTASET